MLAPKTTSAILALAGTALALPSSGFAGRDDTSVFESINAAPSGWIQDEISAFTDESIQLLIQLAQQNMDEFLQMALDV